MKLKGNQFVLVRKILFTNLIIKNNDMFSYSITNNLSNRKDKITHTRIRKTLIYPSQL